MQSLVWLVVVLFCVSTYAQGKVDGFYKSKNQGAIVIGGGFEDSKKYVAGNTTLDLERSTYYISMFTAYGISDNLDVNISLPYISSNKENNLQDISVFLKYKLLKYTLEHGIIEVSAVAGLSTPISNYSLGGLNDIGQQATILDTRGMFHFKANTSWFVTLQSGFSYKLAEVPNSIPATLKVGKGTSRWYYDLYYDYQHTFGGIDYRGTPAPQNFRELGVDFHKVGGTLYRPFSTKWGAFATIAYIFDGRNVFLGGAYGLGLAYNFDLN